MKINFPYPKKAMPIDTPFRIAGFAFVGKEYLLNFEHPGLIPNCLYCRKKGEEQWELLCLDKTCNDLECIFQNQSKYYFMYDWKDAYPWHPIHQKKKIIEQNINLISVIA